VRLCVLCGFCVFHLKPETRNLKLFSMSLAAKLAPLTLPSADGTPVHLGDLWRERPAVVVFLRHWG